MEFAQPSLEPCRVGHPGVANIELCARVSGNYVGNRPARDYGRLHCDSAPWIVEIHQALNLECKLMYCVHAFFRVDASVRRTSRNDDFRAAYTLASGLQLSAGA